MKEISVIFIGRSGCGKGTQAALLKSHLEKNGGNLPIVHLETGALVREFIKGDTYSQKLAKKINDVGGFQPEFLVINQWSNFFIKNITGPAHLIIDGSPRKFNEAGPLDSVFHFYKRPKPYLLYLDTSRPEVTSRLLKRGRADDTHENIKSRLDLFDTDVTKAIEFYRNNSHYHFCDINGDQTIEAVFNDILKALG